MRNHLKKNDDFSIISSSLKIIFFIVFSFHISHSQESINIYGIVTDSISQPLDLITVVVLDKNNRYIANFRTQKDGKYNFKIPSNKSLYILKFKSLAYKVDDVIVNIKKGLKEYQIDVMMYPDITELDAVVVKSQQPIKIEKDTITFKVSSFITKQNEVLEDLLKNLPGIEVDANGIVKVNNQAISKVLIGGDDVFDNNYKIATKNIDASDIEEVEIIYNFDENSVLRALTDSEDIALNISIKKERQGAIYGKTNVGYGNDNNYLGDLTLFNLNNNLKTFLISKTNTIGEKANENLNGSMFNRSGSSYFEDYRAFSKNIITTDVVASNSLFNETYINDNTSYFNSLHLLTKPKKNIHVRGIFYFLDDVVKKENAFTTFYSAPSNFSVFQSKFHREKSSEFNAELNIKNANGSKSFIEYNGIINNSKNETNIDLTIDDNQYNENLDIKDYYFSQQLNTTFRVSGKSALSINLFYLQDKNPQGYSTSNPIFDDQGIITQSYENPIRHYGFNSKLISKTHEWNLGFLIKDEKIISKTLNDGSELQFEDLTFYNNLTNTSKDLFVYRQYLFSLGKKYDLTIKAKGGYNSVKYKNDIVGQNFTETNHQLYAEPELKLSKKTKKYGKYTVSYKFSLKQPGISDVYSGLLLTSNRGFTKGINELFNLYKHRSRISYAISDFRKNIFIDASLSYNYNQNTFGYEYINTPNFDILINTRAKNNNITIASFKVNRSFSSIKSGFFLEYGGIYRRSYVEIAGNEEMASNYVNNIGLRYGSYFKSKINLKSGFKAQFTNLKTSIINNKNTQYTSFFQLVYDINDELIFSLDSKQIYPSESNNIDQVYNFIDIEFKYLAIKNKLDFRLIGQNLTNVRNFQNSYASLISNTNTYIFLNKSFVSLSMSYRF
ncbi:hypothetical protein KO504_02900 [Winogradskyella psychrotolerans]|uniref:hypothetical protein n=1 Tax=Winogradskyella psychrotolerans TaxID=1344585 RepID=UPI001C06EC01|nr:hypothetical protein [Winogradskyella psychrotolerans]MBU2920275.1 hypothetical protein [Winogradskyella psychrotolerans]